MGGGGAGAGSLNCVEKRTDLSIQSEVGAYTSHLIICWLAHIIIPAKDGELLFEVKCPQRCVAIVLYLNGHP